MHATCSLQDRIQPPRYVVLMKYTSLTSTRLYTRRATTRSERQRTSTSATQPTKRDKLSHNMAGPSNILDIKRRTVLIQSGELTERVSLDLLGRAPTSSKPVKHDMDATPVDVVTKKHTGSAWVFTHTPKRAEKVSAPFVWGYDPAWDPHDNLPGEALWRHFAKYRQDLLGVGTPTTTTSAS